MVSLSAFMNRGLKVNATEHWLINVFCILCVLFSPVPDLPRPHQHSHLHLMASSSSCRNAPLDFLFSYVGCLNTHWLILWDLDLAHLGVLGYWYYYYYLIHFLC